MPSALADAFEIEDTEMVQAVQAARERKSQRNAPNPLDQIPRIGGYDDIQNESAHAYYARLDGATIPEVLVMYPNGGMPSLESIADPKKRARRRSQIGANALYYRGRQRARGLVFLGETLTRKGIETVVKIIELNRPYEIEEVKEEIENCDRILKNSESSKDREDARRRKLQWGKRLQMLTQELDPEELTKQLEDAARVIHLTSLPPSVRAAVMVMMAEQNKSIDLRVEDLEAAVSTMRRRGRPPGSGKTEESIDLGDNS